MESVTGAIALSGAKLAALWRPAEAATVEAAAEKRTPVREAVPA